MRKKILIKGPVLSRSGYGEQSRIALRALRERADLFDIYLLNINWGHTAFITSADGDEYEWLQQKILETANFIQGGGAFDMSLQITIPNEFEKIAPINIGYTAGIETSRCAPEWIQKCNEIVDKVITISKHSKKVFEETKYNIKNDETGEETLNWGISKPVEVVNYPVYEHEPESVDIEFTTNKNFLVISQWGIRKNLENTIRWFIEEFQDDEDVGLVLKTNTASDCIIDREITEKRLQNLLDSLGDRKCKIYLIHGELTSGEITWLYQHKTMKALINIAHGEGYGLPLFEAAYNQLPLVTITWSGQMDFICKPNKKGKNVPLVARVDYDLKPVQEEARWPGVITEESMWAYARENSYKRALRDVYNKEKHYKNQAKSLQNHILANFKKEKIYRQYITSLGFETFLEKSDYVFVSDAFRDQFVGGAELSLQSLIDTCPGTKRLVNSSDLTKETIDFYKDSTWIFGNIAQVKNDETLQYVIDSKIKYHFVEFDYKFCEYRNPLLYEMLEDEECDYTSTDKGKLITNFVNGSIMTHFMSQKQIDIYKDSLENIDESKTHLLSSVFDDEFFDKIDDLRNQLPEEKEKYLVLGSRSWVKGFSDSEKWCKENKTEYEVISDLTTSQVLEKLAGAKGICFKPSGLDTCPRYVIEAKLLGCELELNDNVQHLDEEWFNTNDIDGVIEYLRSRRPVFWNCVAD